MTVSWGGALAKQPVYLFIDLFIDLILSNLALIMSTNMDEVARKAQHFLNK